VTSAHASDLFWARIDELIYGIEVYTRDKKTIVDSKGYPITSKKAGQWAVFQTWYQRSFTVLATLAIASYCRTGLLYAELLPKRKVAQAMLEVFLVFAGLSVSVPASMGLVNEYIEFTPNELEPVFQKCTKYPQYDILAKTKKNPLLNIPVINLFFPSNEGSTISVTAMTNNNLDIADHEYIIQFAQAFGLFCKGSGIHIKNKIDPMPSKLIATRKALLVNINLT